MKIERYVIKNDEGQYRVSGRWTDHFNKAALYGGPPVILDLPGACIHKVTIEVHEPELLPCPFCGKTTDLHTTNHPTNSSRFIECGACGTEGPWKWNWSDAEARAAWNRRTS